MTKSKKNTKKLKNKFRSNVCIAIRKKGTELFLVGHRKGFAPDQGWQLPQGGIDPRRELISEMRRELLEEIGTDRVRVLRVSSHEFRYRFAPQHAFKHPEYVGQRQRWVLAEFSGDISEISCSHEPAEFDDFHWLKIDVILNGIVDFKKKVYLRAIKDLGLLPQKK